MTSVESSATTTIETLERTWAPPSGIVGFFTAVNHRSIGLRYIITGLVFFALAGVGALVIRLQLVAPQLNILNPDLYNQLFTMHGTTMMFLFAVPIAEGVGIYLVPLMIGTRDMAFPRLNQFGYFVYLISGVVLYLSLLFGVAPDGGWFAYVPLSSEDFSPGIGIDVYTTMITFLELAALVASIELIVTIFKLRAPGMSLNRIPLFVWSILIMSLMIVFAMPAVMVATVQLALDRTAGAHFFDAAAGGDPLLWQHLFWFFGHPEVYIILIPGLGLVSTILPTFCRRSLIGYRWLVLSFIAIGFISFGLWVHHMFATGIPILGLSFFTIASFLVAVPSGIQIFAAIATMLYGKVILKTPMLFVLGFLGIFVLGGITGVMVAVVPFNLQVHDTYFVIAHFHYVLIGGLVFPLFAGLFYWFPKISGRMLNERLGAWQFWLMFIGFNLAFFPMHISGFLGMPRRVYTYLPGLGWELWNVISTIGAFVFAGGFLLFLANVIRSLQSGERAGNNPWKAGTLEWATASPPPNYNFAIIPTVRSREPLWDAPAAELAPEIPENAGDRQRLWVGRRETLGTSFLDAVPEQRVTLPGPTIVPFLASLAVAFTFLTPLFNIALLPVGALLIYAMVFLWHYPNRQEQRMDYVKAGPPNALPSVTIASSRGLKPTFWWGMVIVILIELTVVGSLISSYFFLRAGAPEWPLGGIEPPDLALPTLNAFILLASSVPIFLADRGIQRGDQRTLKIGLVASFVLAIVFLALKYVEYSNLSYNWTTNAYGSIVWTITGFHSIHVITLLGKTVFVGILAFQNYFNAERNAAVQVNGLYWHFVVVIWIPLFLTLYIAPHIL